MFTLINKISFFTRPVGDIKKSSNFVPEWKAGLRAARYSRPGAAGGSAGGGAVVSTGLGAAVLSAGSVASPAFKRNLGGGGGGDPPSSCPLLTGDAGVGDGLVSLLVISPGVPPSPPPSLPPPPLGASPSASLVHSSSSSPVTKLLKQ